MGVDTMMAELEKLVPLGLKSVLLFSVTDMQKVRHKIQRKIKLLCVPRIVAFINRHTCAGKRCDNTFPSFDLKLEP